jgi:3-deoxy-D-manno-octulosonic-acid transferase
MTNPLSSRFALLMYLAVINLLVPLVGLLVLPFLLFIRKRRKTVFQRLGFQRYPQTGGSALKPVWVHALSVGELLSCVPLLKELRRSLPPRSLYLSVSTLSAHEIALEKLSADVDGLFYFPYDLLIPVHRCLRRVQPVLFLLIETDIWPGYLAEMRRLRIPCFLLNARLSSASFRFSRSLSALFLPAFDSFARIYPQSSEEGERFLALGLEARKICRAGNLKFDLAGPLPSSEAIAELRRSLVIKEKDQVLLAGSTHPGEEAVLRSAFLTLRQDHPELKLIIVPRHPKRAVEVERLFAGDELKVVLLSQRSPSEPDVIIIDRMGLLADLYAMADVTFVGGSLVAKGGQNPIEPAAAGKPVLFGPDMTDFPEVSRLLVETGGAIRVHNKDDLIMHCRRLLADRDLAAALGKQARSVVDAHQGMSRRLASEILAFLETVEKHGTAEGTESAEKNLRKPFHR